MLARLQKYIQAQGFRVHEMAELAPGVIVVHDNYGEHGGEFDAYIDAEAIGPTQPEIWGEEGLVTPGLKGTGLGVLQGVAFGSPPQERFAVLPGRAPAPDRQAGADLLVRSAPAARSPAGHPGVSHIRVLPTQAELGFSDPRSRCLNIKLVFGQRERFEIYI